MSLLGTWIVDKTDTRALAELGDVVLEFRENGQLTYTIRSEIREQIILPQYKVEDGTIITDQPSSSRVEGTTYTLSPDGTLTLEFGGVPYRFRRP